MKWLVFFPIIVIWPKLAVLALVFVLLVTLATKGPQMPTYKVVFQIEGTVTVSDVHAKDKDEALEKAKRLESKGRGEFDYEVIGEEIERQGESEEDTTKTTKKHRNTSTRTKSEETEEE